MKRMFYSLLCLVVALFTTTAYAQGSGGTQTLPYTAYFTDGQGDWTTLANNEGTPNWEFGTNGAYFTNWNGTTASDDYLISPYFAFEAGKTYEVEASFHPNTYGDGLACSVVYGMGDDATAFAVASDLDIVAGETTSVQFTVTDGGNYRVALHNTSMGYSGGCYIPSLTVREVENTGGGDEPSGESFYQISWVDGSITDLGGWSAYSVAGESEFAYLASMPEYDVLFGAVCAGSSGSTYYEIDDYLISPVLPFEVGKTYKVSVTLGDGNTCQDIDLMHGNSLDDTGWTSIGKFENFDWRAVNEFSFTATGEERIAIHAVAAVRMGDCQIASVTIEETAGGSVEEPAQTVPYSKNFDETGNMDGWTTDDANGDDATWTFYGEGFGVMLQNYMGSSNDDYLFSPAIVLEAGQAYKITVASMCTMLQNPTDAITVFAGIGDDVAAYEQIGTLSTSNGENSDEIVFTPDEAGNYKIAFRNNCGIYTSIAINSFAIDVTTLVAHLLTRISPPTPTSPTGL